MKECGRCKGSGTAVGFGKGSAGSGGQSPDAAGEVGAVLVTGKPGAGGRYGFRESLVPATGTPNGLEGCGSYRAGPQCQFGYKCIAPSIGRPVGGPKTESLSGSSGSKL